MELTTLLFNLSAFNMSAPATTSTIYYETRKDYTQGAVISSDNENVTVINASSSYAVTSQTTAQALGDSSASLGTSVYNATQSTAFSSGISSTETTTPSGTPSEDYFSNVSTSSVAFSPTNHMFKDESISAWLTNGRQLSVLHAKYNMYFLGVTFTVFFLGLVLFVGWIHYRKRLSERASQKYIPLPGSEAIEEHIVYKPSYGGLLDQEYEHTFVGVTVPILQEVTRI